MECFSVNERNVKNESWGSERTLLVDGVEIGAASGLVRHQVHLGDDETK